MIIKELMKIILINDVSTANVGKLSKYRLHWRQLTEIFIFSSDQ